MSYSALDGHSRSSMDACCLSGLLTISREINHNSAFLTLAKCDGSAVFHWHQKLSKTAFVANSCATIESLEVTNSQQRQRIHATSCTEERSFDLRGGKTSKFLYWLQKEQSAQQSAKQKQLKDRTTYAKKYFSAYATIKILKHAHNAAYEP